MLIPVLYLPNLREGLGFSGGTIGKNRRGRQNQKQEATRPSALDYTALRCRLCEVTTTHSARRPNAIIPLVNDKCINPPYAFVFVYGVLELKIQKKF